MLISSIFGSHFSKWYHHPLDCSGLKTEICELSLTPIQQYLQKHSPELTTSYYLHYYSTFSTINLSCHYPPSGLL